MAKATLSHRGRRASGLLDFTRFLKERSGNVAMLFGLAAIPFFTMSGMAVDFSRAMMVKNRLGTALDATALALGSQVGLSQQQIEKQARAYFKANYPENELGKASKLDITYGPGTVHISATATVETVILGLVNVDTLDVASEVTVQRNSNNLEVSLIIDVTGSMAGTKINDLKAAANDVVDIIIQETQDPYFSKIALVPFSMAVNVGPYANTVRGAISRPASMPIAGISKANPAVITSPNHGYSTNEQVYITGVGGMTEINNRFATVTKISNDQFSVNLNSTGYTTYSSGGTATCASQGCVSITFRNADNSSTDTRALSPSCVTERVGSEAYTDADPATYPVGLNYPGVGTNNNPCLTSAIVPMTSNRSTLHTAINAIIATGSTAGQIGISWGWYMLSPTFGSIFPGEGKPLDYDTPQLMKFAIFMTDGDFNSPYCNGVIAADAGPSSGGAASHINCNATNGSSFTQAEQTCEAMKDAGITVYTVGFDVTANSEAANFLEACASAPSGDHYKLASNGTELRKAFRDIAIEISNLRITQ